jgi:hypothetical protein
MNKVYNDDRIKEISRYLKPSKDGWQDELNQIAKRYLGRPKRDYIHPIKVIESYLADLKNILRWYTPEGYSHDVFASVVGSSLTSTRALAAYQDLRRSAKLLTAEAERALIETHILNPPKRGNPKGLASNISRDILLLDLTDLYRKYGPRDFFKDGKITKRHFFAFIGAAMNPLADTLGEIFGKEGYPGPIFTVTVKRKVVPYLKSFDKKRSKRQANRTRNR